MTFSGSEPGNAVTQDAEDLSLLLEAEAREARIGTAAARADCLPLALVRRVVAGESPLRIWREHRGLSVAALAERSGLSAEAIAAIEAGATPAPAEAYGALAAALGVDPEDLTLGRESEDQPQRPSSQRQFELAGDRLLAGAAAAAGRAA
jgi:transcriptional regulator with XRE-family HTH domain